MAILQSLRSRSARRVLIQAGFVTILVVGLVAAVTTAHTNMSAIGMTSGFDFLHKSTNLEINFALMETKPTDPYWWFMFMGILNTLFMGIIGLSGATAVGLAVGLMRSGRNPAARLLGTIYIEVFRNLPLILQLFFWYAVMTSLPNPRQALQGFGFIASARGIYLPGLSVGEAATALIVGFVALGGMLSAWLAFARRFRKLERGPRRMMQLATWGSVVLASAVAAVWGHEVGTAWVSAPELKGLNIKGGIRLQPEVLAMAVAIIMYGAAYIGEIVRGGFKAVGRGQVEAARALGLTPWQVFSQVQLPLAFRAMLPILINQYVWLIKATTLGIAIGFSDFFMIIATAIVHSGQTVELIGILMLGFMIINFSLAAVLNRLNRAIALKGNLVGVAT